MDASLIELAKALGGDGILALFCAFLYRERERMMKERDDARNVAHEAQEAVLALYKKAAQGAGLDVD